MLEGPPLVFIASLLGIPPPDVKSENALTEAYEVSQISCALNHFQIVRKSKYYQVVFISEEHCAGSEFHESFTEEE